MKKQWVNLRGKELAVFAASAQAAKERSGLIAHLAQYGTVADFANAVNAKPYPLDYCLEVYKKFPQAAEQWLSNAVQTSDPVQRQKVFRAIVDRVTDFAAPQNLLKHVRFEEMDASCLDTIFLALVLSDLKDVVEHNWNVFEKTMSCNTEEKVTIAASRGWDLATKINWTPSTENKEKYFACCCQGGLMEHIQKMRVSDQTAYKGFVQTTFKHSKNANMVMEYLWNTYDFGSLIQPDVLVSAARTSLKMSENLIAHFKKHAPKELSIRAFYICHQAVFTANTPVIDLFLPYVDPVMHEVVLVNILNERKGHLLHRVLALPYITHAIEDVMPLVSEDDQIWAQELLNKQQAQRLNDVLAPTARSTLKRKM